MADIVSVTTENWKDQLNIESTCTSSGPLDRCGLISELQSWNRVLYGLNYELTETRPGKLRLRYAPHDPVEKWQTNAASMHSEAAFLISWLVEHHSCIDDLGITSIESNAKDSAPLRLRRPPGKDIRCLDISLCKSDGPSLYLVKEDVDGLRGIERLHISDSDATLESSAVTLLRNNSSSLGFVQLSYTNLSRDVIDALQQLEKCESLTVVCCTREGDDTISESNTVASILRSSAALKTFTFAGDRDEEWNFSSISDALETCVTLTAFDLTAIAVGESSSPRELFAALLGHTRLRKLRVEIRAIDASCGETLEWALSSNTWLVDLHLAGYVDDYCLIHIAEGLSQNITLEKLDLSEAVLNVGGALLLCDALRTNKTLKKLMLPDYWDPEEEKKALAEKLKHGDFYRRVRLPILEECDLLALSTRLGCPTTCPDELTDIEFCSISEATLKLFFDALASSSCVQAFSVSIEENPQAKIALLCDMLVANRSIKSLNIALMRDSWLVIQQLLNAIQANENISKLKISVSGAKMAAASAVSEFIARNRTITTFMLWMGGLSRDDLVEEIARGMLTNRTIVEHGDGGAAWEGFSYPIFEALQRNRVALNRAADFVLGIRDSRCAEAFEIFSRTSRLIALVMETSGQNEREAVHAIASADKFLRDNSLDIRGALQCATLPLAQRNKIG